MRFPPTKGPAETMRLPPRDVNETMRMPPPPGTETLRAAPGAETQPALIPGPLELPPGTWEAPPVRVPGGSPAPDTTAGPGPFSPDLASKLSPEERARRRARWIIVGLAVVVGAAIGAGAWVVKNVAGQTEDKKREQARREYQGENLIEAAAQFRALEKDYPNSPHLHTYKFYGALSEVRLPAYQLPPSPRVTRAAYQRLLRFLNEHEGDELLTESRGDVRNTFLQFAQQFADWAKRKGNPRHLASARQALARAGKFGEGGALEPKVKGRIDDLAKQWETRQRRDRLLARLRDLSRRLSGETVREIRALARENSDLANHRAVADLLDRLPEAHRKAVVFQKPPKKADPDPPPADEETSLLVAPSVGRGPGINSWSRKRPVLALARGILYALRPRTGSVIWARRVGIDTTVLPVRLPRFKARPETVLALSSDTNTLTALDALTGKPLWSHSLSAPCLGQPTVVPRPFWGGPDRIYLPCYNGRVEEIDAGTGRSLGSFRLGRGERVSLGAAYDEESGLLYVAADCYCVYVLDLAQRKCRTLLYSEHPAGSLRCRPVLLRRRDLHAQARPSPRSPRTCLILSQADGLEATELRLFPVPVLRPDTRPLALNLRVRGWTWFPPREDGEKLAVATDRGVLGLFGIKQKDNRDPFLFPMLGTFPPGGYVLEGSAKAGVGDAGGRAELVHLDESNFWVLAQGRLHRLRLVLGQNGWKLTEEWDNPVPLGTPLHAPQVAERRTTLFLVTRLGGGQTCLATAVEGEAEATDPTKVKWQRQLGLVCRGAVAASPRAVLVQDHHGGLFRFDPGNYAHDRPWHIVHEHSLADPPGEDDGRGIRLLPFPGGVYSLALLGGASAPRLVIRRFDPTQADPEKQLTEQACDPKAPVAGTPGAWPDQLVFPLVGGTLMRLRVPGGSPENGLDWRSDQADEGAPGHVVPLGAADFLVTDGSRGLVWMTWPPGGNCKEKARLTLPARIVGPPLVFEGPGADSFRVLVADADGRVSLLRGDRQRNELAPADDRPGIRLGGKITAGPFPLGNKRVGCVVDHRRLVVLNAEDNKQVWAFPAEGKKGRADLVGIPVAVGTTVVVADQGGRFVGLDLATGQARGAGHQLGPGVAPACAPVAFGKDRLFAPLSDGTVLLLSLNRLQDASPKVPPKGK
jgi:outer membrane protein assembly factor BamB